MACLSWCEKGFSFSGLSNSQPLELDGATRRKADAQHGLCQGITPTFPGQNLLRGVTRKMTHLKLLKIISWTVKEQMGKHHEFGRHRLNEDAL